MNGKAKIKKKNMTHLYIKICDLCGKPCEAGSQNHAGHITTDIMIQKNNKFSMSVFREEFDICIGCLQKTGLYEILKNMKEQKYKNKDVEKSTKKIIADARKQLT